MSEKVPFKFKLESVLALRETKKKEAMIEVQYAKELINKEKEILNNLLLENKLVERDLTSGSIEKMRQADLYRDILNENIRSQEHKVSIAKENLLAKNNELIETHKELLAVEKLKERRFTEYECAKKKKEQSDLDEFSILRYNRTYN